MRLDPIIKKRCAEQRDSETRECRQWYGAASNCKIELVLHLLHVLCSGIEDQSIFKYESCSKAGFDHIDLRQKILPLVVRFDLISIEALDPREQTDTTGLPGAGHVLRIRKEVAGNKRNPARQNTLFD